MASELIERDMYGSLYHMVHNPNARGSAPRYKLATGEKPKGVTTILGKVLAKDLIGWALDCMADCLSPKLPVITAEDIADAKLESTRRRDSGAGTGTEAHGMVEDFLRGNTVRSGSPEARNAYDAFRRWFDEFKPTIVDVEQVIFSQTLKYAGTFDCLLEVDGVNYLCDLKTTNVSRQAPNGVYAENFIQLGAYAYAWEEERKYLEATGNEKQMVEIDDLMVISAKKNGKLDIVTASELGLSVQECGEMFKRVMSLYNFMTGVTKQLGGR
jgi:hypothetical protein